MSIELTDIAHPRLLLTSDKITALRGLLTTSPYDGFWADLKQSADTILLTSPPADATSYTDNTIRDLGNKVPYLAMAYILSDDAAYLNGAIDWMDAFLTYPNWGTNTDLGASHILLGMALAYDWLFDDFSSEQKATYRAKMILQADILYGLSIGGTHWWSIATLQNHNYVNNMAICTVGIALFGESEESESYVIAAENNFNTVLGLLSPDGFSHEGVGYWGYGMWALLLYFYAIEPWAGKTQIEQHEYFRQATSYRLYMSTPDFSENANYADSVTADWYGPGYILRAIASVFNDGYAQWLAEEVRNKRISTYNYSWLDFIYHDSSVAEVTQYDLPRVHLFSNMGVFVYRSDWSDNAKWVFFKVGPFQGHLAKSQNFYPGSHIHPDEGNILYNDKNNWVFKDDPSNHLKITSAHNVLVVDALEQVGGGSEWFIGEDCGILGASSWISDYQYGNNWHYVVGDLAGMYPIAAALDNWQRHFIVIDSIGFLIVDRIRLSALKPAVILWNFEVPPLADGNGNVTVNDVHIAQIIVVDTHGYTLSVNNNTLSIVLNPVTEDRVVAHFFKFDENAVLNIKYDIARISTLAAAYVINLKSHNVTEV